MRTLITLVVVAMAWTIATAESWIRINQMGYLPDDIKVAVMIMEQAEDVKTFKVTNVATGKTVKLKSVKNMGAQYPFEGTARLDFSGITESGTYVITAGSSKSREFRIGKAVYAGANEVPLRYMRQQRCGYNPFLKLPLQFPPILKRKNPKKSPMCDVHMKKCEKIIKSK